MKIRNLIFVITWIFAAQLRLYRAKDLYAPLIVVYDAKVGSYALTDQEILNKYGPQCSGFILACSNSYHIDSEKMISLDVVSLKSVQNLYRINSIGLVCENRFKPSMVANNLDQGRDFSVGFYFYDDPDDHQHQELHEKLKEHKLPSFSSVMEKLRDVPRFSIYHLNTDMKTTSTNETRHRIISYKPFISANKTPCENFVNAVEEVLPREIGQLYEKANQNKLWKKYEKPYGFNSFVPVQLTPINDFTDSVSRRATCTYYNTVPIFSDTYEKFIEKIENKIRRVADEIAVNTIEVTTKTYGVLELPLLGERNVETGKLEMGKVYLDLDNLLVPVPRVFLKIIHHWVPRDSALRSNPAEHDDPRKSSKYDHYYMIIGVYNNDYTGIGDDLLTKQCDYGICEYYGWNIYTNPNFAYENEKIFCCHIQDSVTMKNLKLDFQGEPFHLHLFNRYQLRSD